MTLQDFEKKFDEEGMSFTNQRRKIANVVLNSVNHPDIDEIFLEVKKIDTQASIATVYRTINLFTDLGLLSKRDFKNKKSKYEVKNAKEHNHIILEDGKIIEFESDILENAIKEIAESYGFILEDYNIELYCSKKNN